MTMAWVESCNRAGMVGTIPNAAMSFQLMFMQHFDTQYSEATESGEGCWEWRQWTGSDFALQTRYCGLSNADAAIAASMVATWQRLRSAALGQLSRVRRLCATGGWHRAGRTVGGLHRRRHGAVERAAWPPPHRPDLRHHGHLCRVLVAQVANGP